MNEPTYIVAALYKFVRLPDYQSLREPLLRFCQEQSVVGTLLLADEGINGTLCGSRAGIDAVLAHLRADPRLCDLSPKESTCTFPAFQKMKVRLKEEIVRLGVAGIDPTACVGTYVKPHDWNALIADPAVILVDTRNDYEYAVGRFRGAVDPATEDFRSFPAWVNDHLSPDQHPRVAMYCTGGIRCEKATSLLLQQGFREVYHLEGGILKYLEDVAPEDSLWEGECYVFDDRVTVDHRLQPGSYRHCGSCGRPIPAPGKETLPIAQVGGCAHCETAENRR